jgi:hypothetical protein
MSFDNIKDINIDLKVLTTETKAVDNPPLLIQPTETSDNVIPQSEKRVRSKSDMSEYASKKYSPSIVSKEIIATKTVNGDTMKQVFSDGDITRQHMGMLEIIPSEGSKKEQVETVETASLAESMITKLDGKTSDATHSWTWRWGDLPVKSRSKPLLNASTDGDNPSLQNICDALSSVSGHNILNHASEASLLSLMMKSEDPEEVLKEKSEQIYMQYEDRLGHDAHLHCPEIVYEEDCLNDEPATQVNDIRKFTLLSMCGHILEQHADAPEPPPSNPRELQNLLSSYGMSARDLTAALMSDPSVVVVVDDFLLPISVALILLEMKKKRRDDLKLNSEVALDYIEEAYPQDQETTRRMLTLEEAVVHSALTEYASAIRTVLPLWAGKRVSQWSLSHPPVELNQLKQDDGHLDLSSQPKSIDSEEKIQKIRVNDDQIFDFYPVKWRQSFADLSHTFDMYGAEASFSKQAFIETHPDIFRTFVAYESATALNTIPWADDDNDMKVIDDSISDVFTCGHRSYDIMDFELNNIDGEEIDHLSVSEKSVPKVEISSAVGSALSSSRGNRSECRTVRKVRSLSNSLEYALDEMPVSSESPVNDEKPAEKVVGFECNQNKVKIVNDKLATEDHEEGETDGDHLSLEDIPYDAISPEPAGVSSYSGVFSSLEMISYSRG